MYNLSKNKLRFKLLTYQKIKKSILLIVLTIIKKPKMRLYLQKKSQSKSLNKNLNRSLNKNLNKNLDKNLNKKYQDTKQKLK